MVQSFFLCWTYLGNIPHRFLLQYPLRGGLFLGRLFEPNNRNVVPLAVVCKKLCCSLPENNSLKSQCQVPDCTCMWQDAPGTHHCAWSWRPIFFTHLQLGGTRFLLVLHHTFCLFISANSFLSVSRHFMQKFDGDGSRLHWRSWVFRYKLGVSSHNSQIDEKI